jgi:hypothetical protein
MGSPWDFAIPQAMQRHGGSNRSAPKAAQPGPAVTLVPEQQPAARPDAVGGVAGPSDEAGSARPDRS